MRLLDRYILRLTLRPLGASLLVVLAALLLERSLRLFSLLVERGGAAALVLEMVANLVPHYLGLALPAAFFISMLVVVARLDGGSELDAMLNTGQSLARISWPFFAVAALLTVFSVLLYGYMQPYSRYDYRALQYIANLARWDATLQEGAFLTRDTGLTLSADRVDASGRHLSGVFVRQEKGNKSTIITAARGRLDLSRNGQRAILTLQDGIELRSRGRGNQPAMITFSTLTFGRPLNAEILPFRIRGGDERELTIGELLRELRAPSGDIPKTRVAAELHARLARSFSQLIMPLIALPLGLAAKRSRRGHSIVIAAIILVTYHHALLLGESLADIGRVPPVLGLWIPVALFAGFGLWAFRRINAVTGANPLQAATDAADAAIRFVAILRSRWAGARP